MAPTQSLLFVLLGILMLLSSAHAEDSVEITLHNEDDLSESSVVSNWTLICEQLCRLNLSGPACGPDCQSAGNPIEEPQDTSEDDDEYNFPSEHQQELCETLCDNGLGGNRCICPIKIVPAALLSQLPRPDRNQICADFCRFHHVTLRGCKQCLINNDKNKWTKPTKAPKPLKNNVVPIIEPHRMDLPVNIMLQSEQLDAPNVNPADYQASSTAPTTPDWNRLCATLCRQGNGGILCNCDLAPF